MTKFEKGYCNFSIANKTPLATFPRIFLVANEVFNVEIQCKIICKTSDEISIKWAEVVRHTQLATCKFRNAMAKIEKAVIREDIYLSMF